MRSDQHCVSPLATPTHDVSPSNQPGPLPRQVALVRLDAHSAHNQWITIPTRLNGEAGLHLSPAVVLYGMKRLVQLLGLKVQELPIELSRKVSCCRERQNIHYFLSFTADGWSVLISDKASNPMSSSLIAPPYCLKAITVPKPNFSWRTLAPS